MLLFSGSSSLLFSHHTNPLSCTAVLFNTPNLTFHTLIRRTRPLVPFTKTLVSMSFLASLRKMDSGLSEGSDFEEDFAISTETYQGKALLDTHNPHNTPTNAIPYSSYNSLDEHPGHLYHEPPMTEKKILKQSGCHKQQSLRFSDDTNIGEKPEVPQLPIRPVTHDGKASYLDAFNAAISKNQSTAAEQEPKKLAKFKNVKSMARTSKANENKKENEPIRAQSQSPVQMPRRPSSASFIAKGYSEVRVSIPIQLGYLELPNWTVCLTQVKLLDSSVRRL
ncbi:hypothetical protein BGX38DRAFT_908046 [Terfezia claveryi]|nr:hypothetical protein BGX38DRAFT_908046 [Terfezia claveryi]